MPRFAFTITGSLHLDDPQVIRAAASPVFTTDGHEVRSASDAAVVLQGLLQTTLHTAMSEALGHRRVLGPLNVNVVEVPEPDPR